MSPLSTPLSQLGRTYGGLTGKSKDDFGRGSAHYVTFMDVISHVRVVGDSLERVRIGSGERQNEVRRGDLLFNGSSETPEEVALSAVVGSELPNPTFLNSFCFGFRLGEPDQVLAEYLAYFFRGSRGRELVAPLAQGATRYNISKRRFLEVELELPDREAVEWTVEALSACDRLIATIEQLLAKKRAIKQGMMQELLSGRTRLPGFSADWQSTRLGQVLRFQVGFPFSSQYFSSDAAGVRLVRNRDLRSRDSIIYYTGGYSDEYLVHDEDVLVGMDGDFSPCVWRSGRALLNQRVGRLIVSSRADAMYLFYALIDPLKAIEGDTGATTVKHLSHGDIENMVVAMPGVDEQIAIGQVLRDADSEISLLTRRLDKSRDMKQGMMQELLMGRRRLVPQEVSA